MKNLRKIFNPSKITISGKSTIVDTDSGKYVIKEKNKDIKSLYSYLNSRSFNNYPSIVDEVDNNYVYEYVNDENIPINQKASDMGKLVGSLHYKTSHYIPIVKDNIKEIYENITGNISYMENYYNKLFDMAFNEEYMRPSYYLLIRNESKINALFNFLKGNTEKWYKDSIDKDKTRVVYCHNNLSINHYMFNGKDYLISWDNYKIDSPVLDLINLYHNDFNKYDYSNFLTSYMNSFNLFDNEKRLLFIVLSMPDTIYFSDNEMDNTVKVGKFIDYINKTEKIIRPYYPIENK